MSQAHLIFDRPALKRQKDRAAVSLSTADFLFREVADRVADRLNDISRAFPLAAEVGSHGGIMGQTLQGRGGIEHMLETDISAQQLSQSTNPWRVVADEENLPLAAGKFDLVLSSLALHWTNDLPGALIQVNRALKPDGLFIGAIFGIGTLQELRDCLMTAESEVTGRVAPRVSPFPEVRDMGGLLQRAGFALPVVDADTIPVSYGNPFTLLQELKAMGESNVLLERGKTLWRRDVLMRAMQLYVDRYGDADGRVPATFEVIYLHGWHPDSSQQKALKPGAGKVSLTSFLNDPE